MTDPLAIPPDRLGEGSPIGLAVLPDAEALARHFAAALRDEFQAALAAGRERAVFIVPVGPVGQYDLLAQHCNETGLSLRRLTMIVMDEYLAADGARIPPEDPLSFRGHMQRHLLARIDPALAPEVLVPDPADLAAIPAAIARLGGVDVCFGGVGITGHLAFNDPPEPGEPDDPAAFARLPTRIVTLSRESRTIAAVTAARGNIARIPPRAVTVGMAEILGARKIRLYMNRPWHTAIVRRLLHGPVTATVPASLLQRHPDARVTVTREVTLPPEPELR